MIETVNLREKLAQFDEIWTPRIVGELNGQQVKVAKVLGEHVWHHHEKEDEMFMVLQGSLTIDFRDRSVTLGEGELCVVPRGVEHRPSAAEMTHIILFEPATTRSTGNVNHDLTVEPEDLKRI